MMLRVSNFKCTTSFNKNKMELLKGLEVDTRFFPAWYKLRECLEVVSADRKFSTQMTSSFWWLQQGIEDFSFLLKQRCSTFKCNRFFESRVLFSLLLFKIVSQWYWKVFKCLLWIVNSYARMELRKYFCIS